MKRLFRLCVYLFLFACVISTFSCQKGANVTDSRVTGDSTQFIKYTIAGTAHNFLSPADSFETSKFNSSINIRANPYHFTDSASWKFTSFNFSNVTGPGTYTLDAASLIITQGIYPQSDIEYHDSGVTTLTITEFGPPGGIIAGHYSGTLFLWAGPGTYSFSCEFRVVRSF